MTPDQLAAATVPDGGEYKRTEAKNRAALEDGGYFTTPDWQEVISPHGVRCFVTRFRDQVPTSATKPPSTPTDLPDDLTIPAFLRRVP